MSTPEQVSQVACGGQMRDIHIDCSAGTISTAGGKPATASPRELALIYWYSLGAPSERIASAVGGHPEAVADELDRLIRDLGVTDAKASIDLKGGAAPVSERPWQQRTAISLIAPALTPDQDHQLVFAAGEGALSAHEIGSIVNRLRAGLKERDIGKGAIVAVDATQRLESYLVVLAALLSGCVVLRLAETCGDRMLRDMVRSCPARITFSARLDVIGKAPEAGERVSLNDIPGTQSFFDWLDQCPADNDSPGIASHVLPTDAALIGFTSGSTGMPKQVVTSHEAIFRSTEVSQSIFGFASDDIFCTSTDFTALSAFRSMITLPFMCGGRVVLPGEQARRQPLALAAECETYSVTRLTAVPNVLRGLAKSNTRMPANQLAALRTVFSGSGVLDVETATRFHDAFGVDVVDYYGGREFATASYAPAGRGKTVRTGGDAAQCLMCLVDRNGDLVGDGEAGEIVVHSDCLTLSPLRAERAGTDKWRGWHFSGDIGRRLPDGRIQIVGRSRDIIKTQDGGLVSPSDIEGLLNDIDLVKEACVFGWSDIDHIERIGAAVILIAEADEQQRQEFETVARERILQIAGPYQVPSRIMVCEELPRVGRGKPDKTAIRASFTAGLDRPQPMKTGAKQHEPA